MEFAPQMRRAWQQAEGGVRIITLSQNRMGCMGFRAYRDPRR